MSSSFILSGRTVSAFPLSVGTSLAFESLFEGGGSPVDPARVIPQHIQIKDYDVLWVNVATLFRNILHSIESVSVKELRPNDVADTIQHEMELIASIMKNEAGNQAGVVFYLGDYTNMLRKYAHTQAVVRKATTELQLANAKLRQASLQLLVKNLTRPNEEGPIKILTDGPDPSKVALRSRRALIMTHVAFDLTYASRFETFHLLESHTGLLKKPNQFYSKYLNGKTLPMMPFVDGLLPVFGDSEMFSPFPIKARNTVILLATTYRWTPLTTRAKVIHDLQYMKDQFLASNIKQFF